MNDEDDVPSADETLHDSMRHSLGIDPLMGIKADLINDTTDDPTPPTPPYLPETPEPVSNSEEKQFELVSKETQQALALIPQQKNTTTTNPDIQSPKAIEFPSNPDTPPDILNEQNTNTKAITLPSYNKTKQDNTNTQRQSQLSVEIPSRQSKQHNKTQFKDTQDLHTIKSVQSPNAHKKINTEDFVIDITESDDKVFNPSTLGTDSNIYEHDIPVSPQPSNTAPVNNEESFRPSGYLPMEMMIEHYNLPQQTRLEKRESYANKWLNPAINDNPIIKSPEQSTRASHNHSHSEQSIPDLVITEDLLNDEHNYDSDHILNNRNSSVMDAYNEITGHEQKYAEDISIGSKHNALNVESAKSPTQIKIISELKHQPNIDELWFTSHCDSPSSKESHETFWNELIEELDNNTDFKALCKFEDFTHDKLRSEIDGKWTRRFVQKRTKPKILNSLHRERIDLLIKYISEDHTLWKKRENVYVNLALRCRLIYDSSNQWLRVLQQFN
eukprot:317449_1